MSGYGLNRRALLRALSGVSIALPSLELLGAGHRAYGATTVPKRFVLSYAGLSTGVDGELAPDGRSGDLLVPNQEGPNYDVKLALSPLTELNIRDDVTVVSGLDMPVAANPGPGGRSATFHYNTLGPMISGVRTGVDRTSRPRGPTADHLVASQIKGGTPHDLLVYRLQVAFNATDAGRMSYSGTVGNVRAVEPEFNLQGAFDSLFGGALPVSEGDPQQQARLRRRQSVLDFVGGETTRVIRRLGQSDRLRVEEHFQFIRDLEVRLSLEGETLLAGACSAPSRPEEEPISPRRARNEYNNEAKRADIFADIIALAFACDQTRVVSYMLSEWKCYLNAQQPIGVDTDMHNLTHGGGDLADLSRAVAWHVRQWGKLVQRLKQLTEADGTTLLDNTALVLLFEGGNGYDPEEGAVNSSHSTENMAALVAGRAGGLEAGKHVKTAKAHPAQVVLSAMNAVGYDSDSLGEVQGAIPELFA